MEDYLIVGKSQYHKSLFEGATPQQLFNKLTKDQKKKTTGGKQIVLKGMSEKKANHIIEKAIEKGWLKEPKKKEEKKGEE